MADINKKEVMNEGDFHFLLFFFFFYENVRLLKCKQTWDINIWEKHIFQGHILVSSYGQILLCSVPCCHHFHTEQD
jgi:hypothetical protein